jgi:hypothetical protein
MRVPERQDGRSERIGLAACGVVPDPRVIRSIVPQCALALERISTARARHAHLSTSSVLSVAFHARRSTGL